MPRRPFVLGCLLWACAPIVLAGNPELPKVDSGHWTTEYDGYFRKYSKRYFGPYFDWQWFKAQAIAESNLNPKARSWVGAQGIMQIMPATFEEIKNKNPHFRDVNTPRWNIAAGIYYDRMLYRKWEHGLSEQERLFLSFASYNAGLGNIRKAYKRSPSPIRKWDDIAPRAPKETQGYVARIRKLKKKQSRPDNPATKGLWRSLSETHKAAQVSLSSE